MATPRTLRFSGWYRTCRRSRALVALCFLIGVSQPMLTRLAAASALGSAVQDLEGHPVDPFRGTDAKGIVLVFVANDCPISNQYAPELRRLYGKFQSQGIRFWLVHPAADESVAAIRRHAADYGLSMGILRDPGHELVRRAHVHVTPEAAVFRSGGRLVYHGRIDDRFVAFGKSRPEPTQRDLEQALEAVVRGKPVRSPAERAVGCQIPDLR